MSKRNSLESKVIEKAMKDAAFKEKLLKDPKGAIQEELGITVPAGVEISVVQETATNFYMVLPADSADSAADAGSVEPLAYS